MLPSIRIFIFTLGFELRPWYEQNSIAGLRAGYDVVFTREHNEDTKLERKGSRAERRSTAPFPRRGIRIAT